MTSVWEFPENQVQGWEDGQVGGNWMRSCPRGLHAYRLTSEGLVLERSCQGSSRECGPCIRKPHGRNPHVGGGVVALGSRSCEQPTLCLPQHRDICYSRGHRCRPYKPSTMWLLPPLSLQCLNLILPLLASTPNPGGRWSRTGKGDGERIDQTSTPHTHPWSPRHKLTCSKWIRKALN